MKGHNVYEVTFRFRVHEDNDADLRKNIEDGGGEHTISTITNRIESRSPKGLNAPHELLDELSIAKDVEVHDLITIKRMMRSRFGKG